MSSGSEIPVVEVRLLGLKETARYLGITPRAVQSLIAKRVLHPVHLGMRRVLLDRNDLAALIERARIRSLDGEPHTGKARTKTEGA